MKDNTALVLINLGVLALTGFVFFVSRSLWAFLILFALHSKTD